MSKRKIPFANLALLTMGLALVAGCSDDASKKTVATGPAAPRVLTAPKPAPPPADPDAKRAGVAETPAAAKPDAAANAAPAGQNPAAAKPAADETPPPLDKNAIEAAAGVGVKGKGYGGGLYTEPISQYFNIQERISFDRIPEQLNIYKALHDGKGPASQAEFDDEIIKPAGIKLPELPAGKQYLYDPKTEKLMVQSSPPAK